MSIPIQREKTMASKTVLQVFQKFIKYLMMNNTSWSNLFYTNIITFVTAYHVSNPHVAKWEWSWNITTHVKRNVERKRWRNWKQVWLEMVRWIKMLSSLHPIAVCASNLPRLLPNTQCTCAIIHHKKRGARSQCVIRCVKFEIRERI